jgi:cell division septum initiation protein DivIVA
VSNRGIYDLWVSEDEHAMTESTSEWGLRRRIDELEGELQRYREQEQLISRTLVSATSHAAAIRESARRDAELTLRKARAEAAKRKTAAERERHDATRELLRLRRIIEQMRSGLSVFLSAKVEELRLEETEVPEAPRHTAEFEAALGSAIEQHSAGTAAPWPAPTSHLSAEIPRRGEHGPMDGPQDGLP